MATLVALSGHRATLVGLCGHRTTLVALSGHRGTLVGQCGHRTTLVVLSGRGAISVVLSGQMATLVKLSGIIVPPRAHSCVHLGLPSGLRPPKRNQSATWITQADLGPSKWHWEDASECLWGHPCGLRSSKVALGPSECHLGHPSGLRSTQMAWVRPRGTREPPGPRLAL